MDKMATGRNPETEIKGKCNRAERDLAQMLLEPEAAPAKVRAHFAECDGCRKELEELHATTALLDSWKVAEPNPYFLTRIEARMREERKAAPAGWLARWRDRYAYRPATHLRPIAAMALTITLLVGGGMYLGIANWDQPPAPPGQTAVVNDLQTMDSNAQLLDQLEALSTPSDNGD